MEVFYTIGILAIATGVIAVTVTRSKVFKSLRLFLKDRNAWLHGLFTCPYCLSHWIAIAFACVVCPKLSLLWGWSSFPLWIVTTFDIVVSVFMIVAGATLVGALIQRVNPFAGDDSPSMETKQEDQAKDTYSSRLNHDNWKGGS